MARLLARPVPKLAVAVLAGGALSLPAALAAQGPLDDYVSEGLRQNLTIRQQSLQVQRSEAALREARGNVLPTATLNARYAVAWAWLGRVGFEQQRYLLARRAYANAAGLEPDNDTYRYFLNESIARAER
jgi:cytochrome c-type biogenesis protein CcmH/NrfG